MSDRKKVVHLAKRRPTAGWYGWEFTDSPWQAACGVEPKKIRLSSYVREVTCSSCQRRIKEGAP